MEVINIRSAAYKPLSQADFSMPVDLLKQMSIYRSKVSESPFLLLYTILLNLPITKQMDITITTNARITIKATHTGGNFSTNFKILSVSIFIKQS